MNVSQLSHYLSKILRHSPEQGRIVLDSGGWVDLGILVENNKDRGVTLALVLQVVRDCEKQRFTIRDGRIRANQGHSVPVDLDLVQTPPPEFLYHGTYEKAVPSILREGLSKMRRHHVHMSSETGTAVIVGRRSGTPVVFRIEARKMHQEGHLFYQSSNGVWLVDQVPPRYLIRQDRDIPDIGSSPEPTA